mmetsp:Transcript_10226/g.15667  ORF Transcript_10226/g.15667 Transcript_10226/m.15667 type:complete len:102 (+) Transcript_10226:110-415(+)
MCLCIIPVYLSHCTTRKIEHPKKPIQKHDGKTHDAQPAAAAEEIGKLTNEKGYYYYYYYYYENDGKKGGREKNRIAKNALHANIRIHAVEKIVNILRQSIF